MGKVRSKNTKIENFVARELKKLGYKVKRNRDNLFGKPDIVIANKKILLFIDSCFWHGCQYHCRLPSSNTDYWKNKINKNKLRDKLVNRYYKNSDWRVIRFWEHNLKGLSKIVKKLENA